MANHQTIRLSRGSHKGPEDGVCVMGLASMLAGEKFTDRPRSVSLVVTRFLRAYNDGLADDRRQDLYPYAARVVGTAATRAVERSRSRLCVDWMEERGERITWSLRLLPSPGAAVMAAKCALSAASTRSHRAALALLDDLIALADSWAGVPADASELERIAGTRDG